MNYAISNLNWNWRHARSAEQAEKYYNADISDDETDVFRCHLNEIDHVQLLDPYQDQPTESRTRHSKCTTQIPTDPRNGRIYHKFLVDHSKSAQPQLFSSFPVKSSMPHAIHHSCIQAITRIRNRGTSTAMSAADCKDLEIYTASWAKRQQEQQGFQEFVQQQFVANVAELMEQVKPFASDLVTEEWRRDLQMAPAGHFTLQTALQLDNGASEQVTLSVEDEISKGGTLVEYNACCTNKWCRPSEHQTQLLDELNTRCLSTNHEATALENQANIVVSAEVLQKLLDYPANCQQPWNIPFEVRDYDDMNYKRICYLDTVLPPSHLSKAERNQRAIQRQVQSCTLKQRDSSLATRQFKNVFPETDELSSDTDMEYKVHVFDEYVRKQTRSSSIVKRPHILRPATIGTEKEPIRLLLENCPKVFEATSGGETKIVNVSTKLEYQSHFGAEQMSASELIAEWCALMFQPKSVTDRYRVDAVSGEVLSVARLTRAEIESEMLRLHALRPNEMLGRLTSILGIIRRLPANKYLLRHTVKSANKVMVYTRTDVKTPTSLDLSQIIAADLADLPPDTLSWHPIDDMEVTRVHRITRVMPCAFPHNALHLLFAAHKSKGKPSRIVANDRLEIVTRAKQKLLDRQKVCSSAASRKRKLVKSAKNKTKKLLMAKKKRNEASIGETIDPYLAFDAQGNMLVTGLLSSTAQSQPSVPLVGMTAQRSVVFEKPVRYDEYVKQANL